MVITAGTKIDDLLSAYPFLEDFLVRFHPAFAMLRNRVARATVGRVATVGAAAGIAGVRPEDLVGALAAEVGRTGSVDAPHDRREKLEKLKEVVRHLHAGGSLEEGRDRFAAAVGDVEAVEIAAMEQELIAGGLPASEVQRLCDVHVGAFRGALDKKAAVVAPPGHPVHTYMAANQRILGLVDELDALSRWIEAGQTQALAGAVEVLERLGGVENHYRRKENALFPLLERHGVQGPTQVMWGVQDQIRAKYRSTISAARAGVVEDLAAAVPGLMAELREMVYKEERILFPLSLDTLTADEWAECRRAEDELGYELAQPEAPPAGDVGGGVGSGIPGLLPLRTGALSLETLNLLLTHLPVDLSFVDETDTVRFYSEGPRRIFPRTEAVIGRKVLNCHPPSSVGTVQKILDAFREGREDVAEFWIELGGRFVHIRYFAVRDEEGTYRGCLEVSQDVTGIRALTGERRLLEWGEMRKTS